MQTERWVVYKQSGPLRLYMMTKAFNRGGWSRWTRTVYGIRWFRTLADARKAVQQSDWGILSKAEVLAELVGKALES